jgi:hypothetical protein
MVVAQLEDAAVEAPREHRHERMIRRSTGPSRSDDH